jgi:hypothetical protein
VLKDEVPQPCIGIRAQTPIDVVALECRVEGGREYPHRHSGTLRSTEGAILTEIFWVILILAVVAGIVPLFRVSSNSAKATTKGMN